MVSGKYNKLIRNIAIVLTIIMIIIDIILYVKMEISWKDLELKEGTYQRAGMLIAGLFRYGTFVLGVISIIIIWVEYLLIRLLITILGKCTGIIKYILSLIVLSVIIAIFIFCIKCLILAVCSLVA